MLNRLSDRDQRTLRLGAYAAVLILVVTFGPKGWSRWSKIRSDLARMEQTLREVRGDGRDTKQAALASLVPIFQTPVGAEQQTFLFRARLSEQIKQAGLKELPLQLETGKKKGAYQRLQLRYQGKCQFGQLLDLLSALKANPYYVGVEALKIDCDPKKPAEDRGDVEIELTVSTFAK